ncbi:MAG: LCP family protein [Nocardiaceae bacterium]|nr:LCP family protein [Nocardiaceae bacterium]
MTNDRRPDDSGERPDEGTQIIRRDGRTYYLEGGTPEKPPHVPPSMQAWSAIPNPPAASTPTPPPRPAPAPPPPPRAAPPPLPRRDPPPRPATRAMPAQPPKRPAPPPRRQAYAPPPPRRPVRIGKLFKYAAILLIVGMIASFAYVELALGRVDALADYDGRVADTPGTNWLLIGADSRAGLTEQQQADLSTGGEVGAARTDTIMLVHIPKSGPTDIISIPRDSYVSIPGNGKDKINAAFAIGGAPLLIQTVEIATSVHIDHYAEVGFGGFAGMVDALGGIKICLDQPLADPLAGIDLPAGCQTLDGAKALGFVRSRNFPNADLQRVQNQRMFLSALLAKATSIGTIINPVRLGSLVHSGIDSLTVDNGDHVWSLAALVWAMRGQTVQSTVPVGGSENVDVGNVLLWDTTRASALFEAIANDQPIPEADITPGGG